MSDPMPKIPAVLPEFKQKLHAFIDRLEKVALEAGVGLPRFILFPGEGPGIKTDHELHDAVRYLFMPRWCLSVREHGERMEVVVSHARLYDAQEPWVHVDQAPLEVQIQIGLRAEAILSALGAHVAHARGHMGKALQALTVSQAEASGPSTFRM